MNEIDTVEVSIFYFNGNELECLQYVITEVIGKIDIVIIYG
jgi:hypothetical protein